MPVTDDQKNKGKDSVPKTKRQIKEEKQKELERVQQQKREADAKAKADIYRCVATVNLLEVSLAVKIQPFSLFTFKVHATHDCLEILATSRVSVLLPHLFEVYAKKLFTFGFTQK